MTLWNFFQSRKRKQIPHKRRRRHKNNPIQRASFCICWKGSYTLEAAVVIPLVAAYLVTVLSFFIILNIQCAVDEALLYTGRKTAVESSIVESEELLLVSAKAYMHHALHENTLVERYIENGLWGIQLWKSDFYGDGIYLRAEYMVKLPMSLWGIGTLKLSSQNYFQKWIGDNPVKEKGEYVYITKNGEVYHANVTCPSIQRSVKETSLEEIPYLRGKDGQRYYECSRCAWKDNRKERVYYTDYGTLYHKDSACNAIIRVTEKVKLSEVSDRRPCSFCYE